MAKAAHTIVRTSLFIALQSAAIAFFAVLLPSVPNILDGTGVLHGWSKADFILVVSTSVGLTLIPTTLGAITCAILSLWFNGIRYSLLSAVTGTFAAIGTIYIMGRGSYCSSKDAGVMESFSAALECFNPKFFISIFLLGLIVWVTLANSIFSKWTRSGAG